LSISEYIWPWQFVHFRVYLTLAVCPFQSTFDLGSLSSSEYISPWQFVQFRVHLTFPFQSVYCKWCSLAWVIQSSTCDKPEVWFPVWTNNSAKVKYTLKWKGKNTLWVLFTLIFSKNNQLFPKDIIRDVRIYFMSVGNSV
jgi:hypothetical protein